MVNISLRHNAKNLMGEDKDQIIELKYGWGSVVRSKLVKIVLTVTLLISFLSMRM